MHLIFDERMSSCHVFHLFWFLHLGRHFERRRGPLGCGGKGLAACGERRRRHGRERCGNARQGQNEDRATHLLCYKALLFMVFIVLRRNSLALAGAGSFQDNNPARDDAHLTILCLRRG